MRDIRSKLTRIRSGNPPRVLDLFSGCGGISLGLKAAGFNPVAGLDADQAAMETWWWNLRKEHAPRLKAIPSLDIRKATAEKFFSSIGQAGQEGDIDVVCGGPPCQAYSRIGKAKLRSLGGSEAELSDNRGILYKELLRLVREVRPCVVLVENVPDSVNYGGENVPEQICRELLKLGYQGRWTSLNAADYGVPQYRERVFIIAVHKFAEAELAFPNPMYARPSEQGKGTALRRRTLEVAASRGALRHYLASPSAEGRLPLAMSAEEALSDLPRIFSAKIGAGSMGPCEDPGQLLPYSSAAPRTKYQRLMRTWPGFETAGWVSGNVVRNTPRDFPIFARMAEGDKYVQALSIAEDLFLATCSAEQERLARKLLPHEEKSLRSKIVPPYDPDKFQEKWQKLRRDWPSHTVTAHLQNDTYSHIHYESAQARGITVREAARLQSFPDGFRFMRNMKEAFSQVGNAVPPLLAVALGDSILSMLGARAGSGLSTAKVSVLQTLRYGDEHESGPDALSAGSARIGRA